MISARNRKRTAQIKFGEKSLFKDLKLLSLLNKCWNATQTAVVFSSCTNLNCMQCWTLPRVQINFLVLPSTSKGKGWSRFAQSHLLLDREFGVREWDGVGPDWHCYITLYSAATAPSSVSRAAGHFTDTLYFLSMTPPSAYQLEFKVICDQIKRGLFIYLFIFNLGPGFPSIWVQIFY